MAKRIDVEDIVGRRFGRLVVLRYNHGLSKKQDKRIYDTLCDCGEEKYVGRYALLQGMTRSCGCLRTGVCRKHGQKKSQLIEWNGEKHTIKEWAGIMGLSPNTMYWRHAAYGVCDLMFKPKREPKPKLDGNTRHRPWYENLL